MFVSTLKMGTERKVDYTAAYCQFLNYRNSLFINVFCKNKGFNYNRLCLYMSDSFVDQRMNLSKPSSDTELLIPLEGISEEDNPESKVENTVVEELIKVSGINASVNTKVQLQLANIRIA